MLSQIITSTQTQTGKAIAILGMAIVLALGIFGASHVSAAGFSAGGGLEVLTPVLINAGSANANGWHLDPAFDNHPVVELFVNQPVHNATYTDRNNIPLEYRVEYGVCQNEPSRARVIARYDANGGLQSTFTGDSNVNWQVVHNTLYQSPGAFVYNVNSGNCGGPAFCIASNSFSGSFALSNLNATATHTTVQVVAKWNNDLIDHPNNPSGASQPNQPDSNLSTSDSLIAHGFAHAFNIWINVPAVATPTPTPTATPTATPQVVKCQDGQTVTMQNGNIVICNNNVNNNTNTSTNNNNSSVSDVHASIGDITVKTGDQHVNITLAKAKGAAPKPAPIVVVTAKPVAVPITAKTGAETAIPALASTLMGGAGMVAGLRKALKK